MRCPAASILGFLVLTTPTLAVAGAAVDAATRAEALQAEGRIIEALDALDEALEAVWTDGPLAFRTVQLVEPAANGERVERTDNTFRPDDTMAVYVEPVGYGFGEFGAPGTIAFNVGLMIETSAGQVLVDAPEAFSVAASTSRESRNFTMTLSLTVPFIRPGDYKAVFSVDDQNSDKKAVFELPFSVALPGSSDQPDRAAPD